MCTVSWKFHNDGSGYDLWFNRDESRKRSRALPPAVQPGGFLAPIDPDGGGTWLATDSCGITTAILNYYDAFPPASPTEPQSRGQLVASLATGTLTPADIEPTVYRPFHLLRVHSGGTAKLLTWDGTNLVERPPEIPLSTSSFRTPEVLAFRETAFHQFPKLEEFHLFHDPEHPAHSPLMVREDARTVSVTHVLVSNGNISQRYFETDPGLPGKILSTQTAHLPPNIF